MSDTQFIITKHHDLNSFRAPRTAHNNLNKIAAALVGANAMSPERALDLRTLESRTSIKRSNLSVLIRNRPGFVLVEPRHGGVITYYYLQEFWDEAKRIGLNHAYPHTLEQLVNVTQAVVKRVDGNTVVERPVFTVPFTNPDGSRSNKYAHIEMQPQFLSDEMTIARALNGIEKVKSLIEDGGQGPNDLIGIGSALMQIGWWLGQNPGDDD